jgi:uncharacterized surface protein with fasciclin (FAS1) repeats
MDESEARQGLRKVLMHHLVEGVVVGRDLWVGDGVGGKGGKGKKSWGTVEGSDVRVVAGQGDRYVLTCAHMNLGYFLIHTLWPCISAVF